MAFRFRLQSVLDHRRHLEDMAMAYLAEKLGAQKECENQLSWLAGELLRARDDLIQRETSGMPAKEYALANEYVTVLRLQVLRQKSRLPMLQADTEQARQKLVEATRSRKVLEILHNKHLARYQKQQLKMEQNILDEAAVGAYVRREGP
ncbi:MAG: flagellar export protein FliJ [Desulfarculaceae bacterium]|jgi:flagellar FliJ protein